jgi:sulfide:quinone oxidoreductase
MSEEHSPARTPPRVIVAGSGVGAVETVLALRALAESVEIEIDLVAREDHFVYRPLAVVEPFGYPPPYRLPLDRLEQTHGVRHVRDTIARVDADAHRITLADGGELDYDALVLATGAVAEQWLPDALAFWGPKDVEDYRALLANLEAGTVDHVLFAVPPGASWALPLYELALLTTAWIADHGVIGAELTLATPQHEPLPLFGPSAARVVRDLLGNRGIHLLTETQVTSVRHDGATLSDGSAVPADRVVTLPRLVGNPPPGLPTEGDRFVPIDEHGAVAGLRDVYAVGDVTAFPVKQGSVAAHQADAAAAAISASLGAPVEPAPFEAIIDAVLLTGVTARYLHADLSETEPGTATVAVHPLRWPPEKIAAQYLAPYLADQPGLAEISELAVRGPRPADEEQHRQQQRRLALKFAHADANMGQHAAALRWLQVLETIDGTLQPEHAELRNRWQAAQRGPKAAPDRTDKTEP